MKQTIFYIFILVLSCVFFSCGEEPANLNVDGLRGSRNPETGNRKDRNEESLCQEQPSCSGDECCKQDPDCKKMCDELFEGAEYDLCVSAYDKQTIADLKLLMDNALKRPSSTNLYTNQNTAKEPLCALMHIAPSAWVRTIDAGYTPGHAQIVIEWMVSKNIWSWFLNEQDKAEVFEALLSALAGGRGDPTPANLLAGLTQKKLAGNETTIFYILNRVKKEVFQSIHNEIIVNNICDTQNRRPFPNSMAKKNGGNCYYQDDNAGPQLENAKQHRQEACILAFYCLAGPDDQSKSEREKVARNAGSKIGQFIEAPITSGGLGWTQESDKWPSQACQRLKDFWHNSSNLNLGLGAPVLILPENRIQCPR